MDSTDVQLPDEPVRPLVIDDAFRQRLAAHGEALRRLRAKSPAHAHRFERLATTFAALQAALQDETLTPFEKLLRQQAFSDALFPLALHPPPGKRLPRVLEALGTLERDTRQALAPCTGFALIEQHPEQYPLLLQAEVLAHMEPALDACVPQETTRLRQLLSLPVRRFHEATLALHEGMLRGSGTTEPGGYIDWRHSADAFQTAFATAFHPHVAPCHCQPGYALLLELGEAIA